MCKNLDKLIPPSFQTLVWSSFGSFFGGLIFACSPGSCHSRRTGALWVAGSWSAGWRDPPSSRCSPADAGPTSGYRLLQTTWGGGGQNKTLRSFTSTFTKMCPKKKKKVPGVPHCLQIHSTACSFCCPEFWHRHTCCCRRLHKHSLGNIAKDSEKCYSEGFNKLSESTGAIRFAATWSLFLGSSPQLFPFRKIAIYSEFAIKRHLLEISLQIWTINSSH